MGLLRARITDKRIGALVKAFLKARVMTAGGEQEETHTGTRKAGYAQLLIRRDRIARPLEYLPGPAGQVHRARHSPCL